MYHLGSGYDGLHLSGRTDRVNQLAHVSLLDGSDNSFVGLNAGAATAPLDASNNVFVGAHAASNSQMAEGSVFVGTSAGRDSQRVGNTVLVGHRAGLEMVDAAYCVAIGAEAGSALQRGSYNTLVGHAAGGRMISGARNCFIGSHSGYYSSNASDNTFVGDYSGINNRLGDGNVFVGQRAGADNRDGNLNTFVGTRAGELNTRGNRNVFVGADAGKTNTEGSNSVFIGDSAGLSSTGGSDNLFLGTAAGAYNEEGDSNCFLGVRAGEYANSAFSCVYVGASAGQFATGNHSIAVGEAAASTASLDRTVVVGSMSNAQVATRSVLVGADVDVRDIGSSVVLGFGISCDAAMQGATVIGTNIVVDADKDGECVVIAAGNVRQIDIGDVQVALGNRDGPHLSVSSDDIYYYASAYLDTNEPQPTKTFPDMFQANSKLIPNSIFIGLDTGAYAQSGMDVVAIGREAGKFATETFRNTFIGTQAGWLTYSSADCTYVGHRAGAWAQGYENTCVGSYSGFGLTNATGNVLVGHQAGAAMGMFPFVHGPHAEGNCAVGKGCLNYVTLGDYNTGVGFNALRSCGVDAQASYRFDTSPNVSVVLRATKVLDLEFVPVDNSGYFEYNANAKLRMYGTFFNVAVGFNAIDNLSWGQYNVAIGADALLYGGNAYLNNNGTETLTGVFNSIALGFGSMRRARNVDECIAIGSLALSNPTSNNQALDVIAIGRNAVMTYANLGRVVAVGAYALSNSSARVDRVVAYGSYNMQTCSGSIYEVVSLGYASMVVCKTASQVVSVGTWALSKPEEATLSVCVGGYANQNSSYVSNSVCIGAYAARDVDTYDVVAIGTGAARTTGFWLEEIVALGSRALSDSYYAANAVAIGHETCIAVGGLEDTVSIGPYAMQTAGIDSTGIDPVIYIVPRNVCVGAYANQNSLKVDDSVCIGAYVAQNVSTRNVVALGVGAVRFPFPGTSNVVQQVVALGSNALSVSYSAFNAVAIGHENCSNAPGGLRDVVSIGAYAMNVAGYNDGDVYPVTESVAVGTNAAGYLLWASNCVFVGQDSGRWMDTAMNTTLVGHQSLVQPDGATRGGIRALNCTVLGSNVTTPLTLAYPSTYSNMTVLGSNIVVSPTADSNTMIFAHLGQKALTIGNAGQLTLLSNLAYKATGGAWLAASDARVKRNVRAANLGACYDSVKSVPLREFEWTETGAPDLGWVAQEVETVVPEAVNRSAQHGFDDFRCVDSDPLLKRLFGAVQHLMARVEALEAALYSP